MSKQKLIPDRKVEHNSVVFGLGTIFPSLSRRQRQLCHCEPTTSSHTRRYLSFCRASTSSAIMSFTVSSRAVLRQSAKLTGRSARRFESTSTKASETAKDAASKAKETAANFQSKATEGLSKVSAAAGPALAGAAKGLGNALGKVGGRTGKLIGFIESMYLLQNPEL